MTTQEAAAREELGILPESKDVFGKRARTFDTLVQNIAEAQRIKSQAEKDIKDLKDKLEVFFADAPSKTILSGGSRATLVMSSNSHLDRKMLLEKGVPAQTILDCTKTTSYSFIKVTAAKEG